MRTHKLVTVTTAVAVAGALAGPGVAGAAAVAAVDSAPTSPVSVRANAVTELDITYQVQETGYWCGPAAARIAQSTQTDELPSQAELAAQMGTTENGTDHISQVTDALNANIGSDWYTSTEMPNDPPTTDQKDQLWSSIVHDVDSGYAVVTNIVAPPSNHPPGYPDHTIYHYFTVVGYNDGDATVKIADPASFSGNEIYWLSFDQLASLIPPKGYAA